MGWRAIQSQAVERDIIAQSHSAVVHVVVGSVAAPAGGGRKGYGGHHPAAPITAVDRLIIRAWFPPNQLGLEAVGAGTRHTAHIAVQIQVQRGCVPSRQVFGGRGLVVP